MLGLLCHTPFACPEVVHTADPGTYRMQLRQLGPGDRLQLMPGEYRDGLPIHHLQGTPGHPITISGPEGEPLAIFIARPGHNTISIVNSRYVTIRDLVLDGRNLPVDGVKCEGHADWAHHITLAALRIRGHGHNQQTVGISTKCPAWDWTIRENVIEGAGTGLYLGNSDGRAPFIGGLIEHNLVVGTRGYNLQIKHQQPRPALPGMPDEDRVTIIRHNVFSKAQGGSEDMARPNVLVGHWPLSGPGARDRYLVYGNFFHQNPYEALFQGEGNIALYSNLFVNHAGDAVRLQPHNDTPRAVDVFHNTVVAGGSGIVLERREHDPEYPQFVTANIVFAGIPIRGASLKGNLTGSFDAAPRHLVRPFAPLGAMSLMPAGAGMRLQPDALARFGAYLHANLDFDGYAWETDVAGAYAPGRAHGHWRPALEIKLLRTKP